MIYVELTAYKDRHVYILGKVSINMLGNILQAIATWSILSKARGSTITQDLRDALEDVIE